VGSSFITHPRNRNYAVGIRWDYPLKILTDMIAGNKFANWRPIILFKIIMWYFLFASPLLNIEYISTLENLARNSAIKAHCQRQSLNMETISLFWNALWPTEVRALKTIRVVTFTELYCAKYHSTPMWPENVRSLVYLEDRGRYPAEDAHFFTNIECKQSTAFAQHNFLPCLYRLNINVYKILILYAFNV
jgi:hypothetical protein